MSAQVIPEPAAERMATTTPSIRAAGTAVMTTTTRTTSARHAKSISISDFDPDFNQDGTVDAFEAKMLTALKSADVDGSGTLSPAEMVMVFRSQIETQKSNRRLSRTVSALFLLVVLLLFALVGVSISGAMVGGEAIKESHVPDCDDPANAERCSPEGLVRVGTVESFAPGVYNLANAPPEQLAYLRDVTMYVDMSAASAVGAVVGATFKIAGAYKSTLTQAFLVTTSGSTIYLDADAQSGTITMDGATYPVLETAPPAAGGRRLEEMEASMIETVSGRGLAMHHEEAQERRRLAESEQTVADK